MSVFHRHVFSSTGFQIYFKYAFEKVLVNEQNISCMFGFFLQVLSGARSPPRLDAHAVLCSHSSDCDCDSGSAAHSKGNTVITLLDCKLLTEANSRTLPYAQDLH